MPSVRPTTEAAPSTVAATATDHRHRNRSPPPSTHTHMHTAERLVEVVGTVGTQCNYNCEIGKEKVDNCAWLTDVPI